MSNNSFNDDDTRSPMGKLADEYFPYSPRAIRLLTDPLPEDMSNHPQRPEKREKRKRIVQISPFSGAGVLRLGIGIAGLGLLVTMTGAVISQSRITNEVLGTSVHSSGQILMLIGFLAILSGIRLKRSGALEGREGVGSPQLSR